MLRALQLAARGNASTHPNPRVGCVIVNGGEVVGEGWHHRAGEPHAEVNALTDAGARARGGVAYVTLEPCSHHGRTPPCVDALIAAGIGKVVAAMQDSNPLVSGRGLQRLRECGIEVESGLCEAQARDLNRGFISRMTRKRPWLTLKIAASLDGRTAMASGESRWISGPEARADVHRLRAEAGAVLVGAGTVLADDPDLGVRDWQPEDGCSLRVPDRIVLDSGARVPGSARVWRDDGARRFWLVGEECDPRVPSGVRLLTVGRTAEGHLDLSAVLKGLGENEVNEVLVEAGAALAGAMLQADVVDEWQLYLAPVMLGERARPLAILPGLERLSDRLQFRMESLQPIGADLRLCLRPLSAGAAS